MILIVSINFISFDAGSMSCFKTIQPINFMLFCFWLLLDLTTWITTINVHYDTKYGSQTWVHRGCLLILQREPFFNYTSLWKYLWWILLSQRASHSCSASQIQGGCLSAAVWVPVTAPTMACQAGAMLSVAADGRHGGGWAPQIPESESAHGEYPTQCTTPHSTRAKLVMERRDWKETDCLAISKWAVRKSFVLQGETVFLPLDFLFSFIYLIT